MNKDVSLTGGTTITFQSQLSQSDVHNALSSQFKNIIVTSVSDTTGRQTALIVTVPGDNPEEIKQSLEDFLGYPLTEENASIEFTGSSLSQQFYNQLVRAVIFAFILMALVVFLVFGESKKVKVYAIILSLAAAKLTFPSSAIITGLVVVLGIAAAIYSLALAKEKKFYIYSLAVFLSLILVLIFPKYFLIAPIAVLLIALYTLVSVPSIAVIFAAFADIVMTLAVVNLLGLQLSSAGIVAFLMLIGYSVDTDILLTTRVLRRKTESVNNAIYSAFKTGITMTLTSIAAVTIALFIVSGFGSILNQIFTILLIGLIFDIFNTWVTNAGMIKWYAEKHG
jgi:preprotein translocase subunit SecF